MCSFVSLRSRQRECGGGKVMVSKSLAAVVVIVVTDRVVLTKQTVIPYGEDFR